MRAAILEVPLVDDHVIDVVEVLSFGFDADQHLLEILYAVNDCLLFSLVFHSCLLSYPVDEAKDIRMRNCRLKFNCCHFFLSFWLEIRSLEALEPQLLN